MKDPLKNAQDSVQSAEESVHSAENSVHSAEESGSPEQTPVGSPVQPVTKEEHQ